jgi:hypothetical protein
MKLLIEYFKSKNEQRDIEYLTSINENINCSHFDKIYVFISDDSVLNTQSPKIEIVKIPNRPTFKFLFEWSNQNLTNEICVIANTDIFFDDTLSNINITNIENKFIALTRWDLINHNGQWGIQYYNHQWRGNITTALLSQDSWIYKTPIKVDDRSDFMMGKPGCDNRIVQIMQEQGYNVINPSMKIITKHIHLSNYRTYNNTDMVMGPYLLVAPTDDVESPSQIQTIPHF